VRARHAAATGLDRIAEVQCVVRADGARREDLLGRLDRQFIEQRAAVAAHTVDLGEQDQLVRLDRRGHRAGHVFHRQIERLAGRRKTERRDQHDRAVRKHETDRIGVDLAHEPGQFVVDAVDNAERARSDKIAADDAHLRMRHRRRGQALRKRSFDVEPDLAGRLLRAFERRAVGDTDVGVKACSDAFEGELRLHLRSRTVNQHQPDPHRVEQRQILHQRGQCAGFDQAARKGNHERATAVRVHVRAPRRAARRQSARGRPWRCAQQGPLRSCRKVY
jgi:hypothetical protein